MADEKKLKAARNVYESLCDMLDEKGIKYDKHPEDLVVTFVMQGEDIPMQFVVQVDSMRELIRVASPIPVTFDGDKRLAGAIVTSQANYKLVDGSFDYDYNKGKVYYRMTSSYIDSVISKELCEYMVGASCYIVDEFNDKFLMVAKGGMSALDYIKTL